MNYASYVGVGVWRDGEPQLVAMIRLGALIRELRDLYSSPDVCRAAVTRLRELNPAAWRGEDVTAFEDRERGFYLVPPGVIWRDGTRRELRTIRALTDLIKWLSEE